MMAAHRKRPLGRRIAAAAAKHHIVLVTGGSDVCLLLRQLAVQMESEYVEPQRVATVHREVAILNCTGENVTMIIEVIQILPPEAESPCAVSAKLATVGPLPVHLVIVFVIVECGLEAQVAGVAQELAPATVEDFHHLIYGRLCEPVFL